MSFQQLTIIGRLGRDPEMRYTQDGQPVTSFSVAVNRSFNDRSGEKREETTWFRVSAWGKLAEVCNEYLHKGDLCQIIGRLNCDPNTGGPRLWQGQNGTMNASFEVTASQVTFLSPKNNNSDNEENAADLDEIPF